MSRTNIVLAVALTGVLLMAALGRVDYSQPNYEIMPDMKYTPAATAYSPNQVFRNGRTLQASPRGTIARGSMPLHFTASKEDALRAGEELENPFAVEAVTTTEGAAVDGDLGTTNGTNGTNGDDGVVDDGVVDGGVVDGGVVDEGAGDGVESAPDPMVELRASQGRGAEVFQIYCVVCHGATGAGDGPVPQRGFPPPPSLLTGKSRQMKDGQLFHILTYGQASMSPFAAQLDPAQRWDVINHVRKLQESAPSTETTVVESGDELPENESEREPEIGSDQGSTDPADSVDSVDPVGSVGPTDPVDPTDDGGTDANE